MRTFGSPKPLQSQLILMGCGSSGGTGAAPNSAAAQAYFDRLVPYPSAAREAIFGAFIDGLATDIGDAFDFLFIACHDNITNALTDLWRADRQGRIWQNTSGLTFTADRGFSTGNIGSNVNSHFNPSTASGAKYTLNDAMVGYWCHSADGAGAILQYSVYAATDAAGDTALPELKWYPKWSGAGAAGFNLNCTTDASATNSVGYNRFNLIQRESSTVSKYYGDTNTAIVTSAVASTAMPNGNIHFRCEHPMTIVWAGRSLTSPERVALRSHIQTLVTAITGGLP